MSEMLEAVVGRVLDALEAFPDFKFYLEQAASRKAFYPARLMWLPTRKSLTRRLTQPKATSR